MKQNCKNCKYYIVYDDGLIEDMGDCFRYPKEEKKHIEDWCGEWKKK
jgi:hypothetical protein